MSATAPAPTHADGMLFMEYYKLWDTPRDSEAWTLLHGMRNGLLHPDLYFEGWVSPRPAWDLVAEAVRGLRESNPEAYVNSEWLAGRYDEWLAARSPR